MELTRGFLKSRPTKTQVLKLNAVNAAWDVIGPGMVKLFSGRNVLHGIDGQNNVWMYSGTPNQWTNIGGPFRSVDANDFYCFGIPADGQSVQMRSNAATGTWATIYSGSMAGIVGAGNALYGLTGSQGLLRYNGTGTDWTTLAEGGFSRVIPQGLDLLGLSADQYCVYRLQQGDDTWKQVAGPSNSLWANDGWAFGLQSGSVVLRSRGDMGNAFLVRQQMQVTVVLQPWPAWRR
jgi:hypothetical protein